MSLQNVDIAQLRSFLAAVDLGGFGRAAAVVNRSQSTVTTQLQRLEDIVGVPLFQRDGRGRKLSKDGEEFVLYARRIVALHDEALDVMRTARHTGHVRLGVMDDYAIQVLPALIAEFIEDNPQIYVEVTSGFSETLLRQLGASFDLVLSTHPVGAGAGEVLRFEKTRWAFAANRDLPTGDEVPLALLTQGNLFRRWALQALEEAGRRWRVTFTGTNIAVVEAASSAGIGVTVVKETTANENLRLLGSADGFPDLPGTEIVLNRPDQSPNSHAEVLARFLRGRLGHAM